MSCSPFDLKDYLFGELGEAECARVRTHVESCRGCAEELDRLRLTEAALHSLREEEPPRRIAFVVSDRVFEPRWWQVWWNSAPRLGFASAALLAIAILVHAFARPVVVVPRPAVEAAAIEASIRAGSASRVDAAVRAAVAESEARQARKTADLVEAARRDIEFQRRADRVAFEETVTLLQKRYNGLLMASAEYGGRP
ncbi:MAG: zf-HC2 domain-containing protein [Bryobacteraceae bacterium]|jgi:anti-sigma factor RsiW